MNGWLILLLWVLWTIVVAWVSAHFAMWSLTRIDAQDKGDDPDEFYPWSWRAVVSGDLYFGWLTKRLEEEEANGG